MCITKIKKEGYNDSIKWINVNGGYYMERRVFSTFESFKAQNEELSAGLLHQEDLSILSKKEELA